MGYSMGTIVAHIAFHPPFGSVKALSFLDQFVGTVVFIGDGSRTLGDRSYVPVVVIRVFVGRVAAVLVCGQQRRLGAVGPWMIGQRGRVPRAQIQGARGQPAHAVVYVRQLLTAGEGHLLRPVVVVVGVDRFPGDARYRVDQFAQVVVQVVFVPETIPGGSVPGEAVLLRKVSLCGLHAPAGMLVLVGRRAHGLVIPPLVQRRFVTFPTSTMFHLSRCLLTCNSLQITILNRP